MEDWKVLEHEIQLSEEEMAASTVCFHAQQVVEKLLKAYLISKKVDFPMTHDLKFLLELCRKQDEEFEKIEVRNLTSYAVEVRYPDEFFIPSVEEAKECAEIAGRVKEFIRKKLNI